MSENSEPTMAIRLPPAMAEAFEKLVIEYAASVGEKPEDCRRLVEVAVMTRGVRILAEQVHAAKNHAGEMGWE